MGNQKRCYNSTLDLDIELTFDTPQDEFELTIDLQMKSDTDTLSNQYEYCCSWCASEFLSKSHIDVNPVNEDGFDALMIAAFNGHNRVVELLINSGANLNHVDKVGNTALMIAVQNRLESKLELLLKSCAKINRSISSIDEYIETLPLQNLGSTSIFENMSKLNDFAVLMPYLLNRYENMYAVINKRDANRNPFVKDIWEVFIPASHRVIVYPSSKIGKRTFLIAQQIQQNLNSFLNIQYTFYLMQDLKFLTCVLLEQTHGENAANYKHDKAEDYKTDKTVNGNGEFNENQRNIQHTYEKDKNGVKCRDNNLNPNANVIEETTLNKNNNSPKIKNKSAVCICISDKQRSIEIFEEQQCEYLKNTKVKDNTHTQNCDLPSECEIYFEKEKIKAFGNVEDIKFETCKDQDKEKEHKSNRNYGFDKNKETECWLLNPNFTFKQDIVAYPVVGQLLNAEQFENSNLRVERYRLMTFSELSYRLERSVTLLAADGFFYMKTKENNNKGRIQCYFCKAYDPVNFENVIHQQDCPMLIGNTHDNNPIQTDQTFAQIFSKLYPPVRSTDTAISSKDIETDASIDSLQPDQDKENRLKRNKLSKRPLSQAPYSRPTLSNPQAAAQRHPALKAPITCTDDGASSLVVVSNQDYITSTQYNRTPTQAAVNVQPSTHTPEIQDRNPPQATSNTNLTQQSPSPNRSNAQTLHSDAFTPTTRTPSQQTINTNQQQQNQTQPRPNVTNLSTEANQLAPVSQTQPTGTNHAQQEPAANRPGRRPGHTPTYSELGIITERPKRNDYALKIKRLESFESWPRGHHLTPNELADAGFYYAGYGDCARCFYCGGGLRNWEDEDNVWVEHARWFPKCAFIRQQMGQMFVDTVKGLNEDRDQITYDMVIEKMRDAGHTFNLENKENPLMKDPAVRTVVDMGYTMKDALQVAMIVKEEGSIMSSDTLLEKLEQQKIQKVNTTKATPLAITYDNDETQFALPSSSQTERSSNGAQQLALTNGDEGMQVALIDPSSGQVAARDVYTSSDKIFEMIRAIKESNNQLRQQTVCKICMDKEVAVVFLPCGHLVSCGDCAVAMRDCPVCRVNVKGIVRAFIA